MKKFMLVALATTAILYSCSPKMNTANHKSINLLSTDRSGKPMLLGECNSSFLAQAPFSEWYNKNLADYKTNDSLVTTIKPFVKGKTFLLFLGTWCGDSKREVPRMLKILKSAGVRESNIKLVMVDNHDSMYKQSPQHEERGLNIHRVPTLLVYDGNKELGRIVESPIISLEKDLLSILSGADYKPNYKAVRYLDSLFRISTAGELGKNQIEISSRLKSIVKNSAELNSYGYVLMYAKEQEKALITFKLNALMFPTNANMYDSLGEYYFNHGDKIAAKENYKKVLELDPANANAKMMLEKM